MAAPIAGQILGEVLPYLEVYKANNQEIAAIPMPDCVGLTVEEVKKVLEGFDVQIQSEEYSKENKITKQIPASGVEIQANGKVFLYVD